MRYPLIFSFIARLAIICNFFYLITLGIMFFPGPQMPAFLANFLAVIGLEMAPYINLVFAIMLLEKLISKKAALLPKWQVYTILGILMIQILSLFI